MAFTDAPGTTTGVTAEQISGLQPFFISLNSPPREGYDAQVDISEFEFMEYVDAKQTRLVR
jgi:hypothetical protein